MQILKLLTLTTFLISALAACGGGSGGSSSGTSSTGNKTYSGETSPAAFSESNSNDLGDSSIAVVKSLAVDSDAAGYLPVGIEVNGSIDKKKILGILDVVKDFKSYSNLPIGASQVINGSCGGSQTISGSEDDFSVVFNNYCESVGLDEDIIFNGKVTGTFTDNSETIFYDNLEMNIGGDVATIVGTIKFSFTDTTDTTYYDLKITSNQGSLSWIGEEYCEQIGFSYDCTYKEYITADNGLTYRVDDYDVYEAYNGWVFEGKVFDPNLGYFQVVATGLNYCSNGSGQFESGTIILTDSNDLQIEVEFTSCGNYTVTFSGVSSLSVQ